MELGPPGLSRFRKLWLYLLLFALLDFFLPVNRAVSAEGPPTFTIRSFAVEGNTLLTEKTIRDALKDYKGPNKTAQDVEKARSALEKLYHDRGYPAVLVNIPEQTVEWGKIRLQVIESRIGNVRVTGNRYFTAEMIMRQLPSLAPGQIIYVPRVQKELEQLNRGEDLKVSPVLSPGMEPGTTDVELKVVDRLPLHGSLEINNRNTLNTSDLRLNGMLRYDNLWQMDHSVSAQFQTSPEDTGQVKLYALSYTLPAPWAVDHQIALYGIRSDSSTVGFGEGLLINGKGSILGMRYVIPLAPYGAYAHNITLGLDYKDFEDTTGFFAGGGYATPVKYLPLSFSYSSSLADSWGSTKWSSVLNMVMRGLVTEEEQFQIARYQARGDYLYLTAGMERSQKLPGGMAMYLKVDGQIAVQPLITHEQYIAGGMANVRGYREASALGDDALHGTGEISAPDIWALLGLGGRVTCTPYLFYDFAWLETLNPLPSQIETTRLQGTGAGMRGGFYKNFYYEVDVAFPVASQSQTDVYREKVHFKVGVQF